MKQFTIVAKPQSRSKLGFYVSTSVKGNPDFYLFSTRSYASISSFFGSGRAEAELHSIRRGKNMQVDRILDKLPTYIRYARSQFFE